MHKRKRDWPITALKFRAYPAAVPQKLWDIAKSQHELWNNLAVLAGRYSEWTRWWGDKRLGWVGFYVKVDNRTSVK